MDVMCNTRSKTRDKVSFNHPTQLKNRKQLLITSAITDVLNAVKRLDNFQVKQNFFLSRQQFLSQSMSYAYLLRSHDHLIQPTTYLHEIRRGTPGCCIEGPSCACSNHKVQVNTFIKQHQRHYHCGDGITFHNDSTTQPTEVDLTDLLFYQYKTAKQQKSNICLRRCILVGTQQRDICIRYQSSNGRTSFDIFLQYYGKTFK